MANEILKKILAAVENNGNKIGAIHKRLDEHYSLLKSLEHRADVTGADVEALQVDMAKLTGRVKNIENKMDGRLNNLEEKATKMRAEQTIALDIAAVNRLDIKEIKEDVENFKKVANNNG